MALTPEEQAQLALLTAKAAEPEGGDSTTVVVQVEQPDAHAEPDGDERPPAAPVVEPPADPAPTPAPAPATPADLAPAAPAAAPAADPATPQ